MYLFTDNGKPCAAKTVFMIAFFTCIIKVILSGMTIAGFTIAEADYSGMSVFLAPLAALYWGRSNTKAGK